MARAFDSTPKKLAIPLFGLFFIGWIVFTAGFSLLLSNKAEDTTLKEDTNRKSLLYFPYYMTLVGGIFVALLGLIHAALPSGVPSSIIGAISTILNTIYFVSVGYVINKNYYVIFIELWWDPRQDMYYNNYYDQTPTYDPQLVRAVKLMLAGAIILTVSWGLVQLLSQFFNVEGCQQPVHARNLWCVIIESWKNKTTLVRDVSESVRLSSIPAMLFSAVGWCVFIRGLHYEEHLLLSFSHGGWSAATITPLMYFVAILHAGSSGKASTLMGIVASILNTFFVIGMGYLVTIEGSSLYQSLHQHSDDYEYSQEGEVDAIHSSRLMLSGGVVCLVFWTVVLVLWPFYRSKGTSYSHVANGGINNGDSDDDCLLVPASSSQFAVQPHSMTASHEYTQQPRVEEYRTPE